LVLCRSLLGQCLRSVGRVPDAIQEFDAVLALDSTSDWTRFNRADALISIHDARAKTDLEMLRSRYPEDAWTFYLDGIGTEASVGSQSADGRRLIERALRTSIEHETDGTPQIQSNRALYLLALGRGSEAKDVYRDLLARGALRQLLWGTLPELDALAKAVARPDVDRLRDWLRNEIAAQDVDGWYAELRSLSWEGYRESLASKY
jgi:tetratricopeptide (TPR) repeat protein